ASTTSSCSTCVLAASPKRKRVASSSAVSSTNCSSASRSPRSANGSRPPSRRNSPPSAPDRPCLPYSRYFTKETHFDVHTFERPRDQGPARPRRTDRRERRADRHPQGREPHGPLG